VEGFLEDLAHVGPSLWIHYRIIEYRHSHWRRIIRMKRFLFFIVFLGGCSSFKESIQPVRYDPHGKFDFYFSGTDYILQGKDSTKICIVDKGRRSFPYTWCWPKYWSPVNRITNKDEIYLGSGFIAKHCLSDSMCPGITLLKFNDSLK
jgi:hypothetical protein